MEHRNTFFSLSLLLIFLVLVPAALASNTWYVDGVHGNDNNNCMTPQTACKTIGHAISLASPGAVKWEVVRDSGRNSVSNAGALSEFLLAFADAPS